MMIFNRTCILIATLCCTAVCASGQDAPPTVNLRRTVTVDIVQHTKDAVVYISTTKIVSRRVSPFGQDPFWAPFDMGGRIARVPANSLGSGFIVHRDGYIVTNNHVIDRARQISVELLDGRKLPADIISADPEADLAILKIKSDKALPTLELGDSSDLMIGEPVIAVGNPLGYAHSVSTGIVSALHRDLKGDDEKVLMGDLIQTDAAINPGNSGGPLLNAYGQVIGINTAIRGDAQNIGFAIPIDRLRDLVPALMDPSHVTKFNVPVALTEKRELSPPANVKTEVLQGTKRVAAIDGRVPTGLIDAYAMLLKVGLEQKSVVVKYKDGTDADFKVTAVPQPDAVVEAKKKLGIVVEQLTPMVAQQYGLQVEDGLVVSEVLRDSVGGRAGIRVGDVIVQLGRYRVTKLDDLSTLLQRVPETGKVRVGVLRGDQMGFGTLEF